MRNAAQVDPQRDWTTLRHLQSADPLTRHESARSLASICGLPAGTARRFQQPALRFPSTVEPGNKLTTALLAWTIPPALYPAHTIVFMEGQSPVGVWLLASGAVRMTRSSPSGKNIMLRIAQPGAALGLSAVIAQEFMPVTVETIRPSEIAFVEREHLQRLMSQASVAAMVAEALSMELQANYSGVVDLVLTRCAKERVARILLAVQPHNSYTHQQLADLAACSRETVTRNLGRLQKQSIISCVDGHIDVLDRSRSIAICE